MVMTAKKWQATIKIGDLHERYQVGELPVVEVAKRLADRVEKYRDKTFQPDTVAWNELDDIIAWFRDDVRDVDDYDGVLEALYDWADEGHRLWVDKFANWEGFQMDDSVENIEASHAPISREGLREVASAQFAEKDALISKVIGILKAQGGE